jgi:hypothetical protein
MWMEIHRVSRSKYTKTMSFSTKKTVCFAIGLDKKQGVNKNIRAPRDGCEGFFSKND